MRGKERQLESRTEIPEQIRVLLVNDSLAVLHELKASLAKNKNIAIVDTVRTKAEVLAAVGECRPDVVLLDVQVGSASGIAVCEIIKQTFSQTAVLFVTACQDSDILRSAIDAGAQGYVLKSCGGGDIAKSIEIVSAGRAVIDPTLTAQIMRWIREGVHIPSR